MVEIDEKKAEYWLKKAEESPRGQRAFELFKEGYNCSQAVVLAFADLIGMDEKLLTRVTSSFGGGMGRLREVCGAVSGMSFVAGALYGYEEPGAAGQEEKAAHYTDTVRFSAGAFSGSFCHIRILFKIRIYKYSSTIFADNHLLV